MGKRTLKKDKLWPRKYYSGLSKTKAIKRKAEIKKFGSMHWTNPKAYIGFETDKGKKTRRRSSYTVQWYKRFPNASSLKDKSKVTGVPLKYIDHVYRKGVGAWRTGHRPYATKEQWGYARVHSFLLCGKTYYGPDNADVRRAVKTSKKAREWFSQC